MDKVNELDRKFWEWFLAQKIKNISQEDLDRFNVINKKIFKEMIDNCHKRCKRTL